MGVHRRGEINRNTHSRARIAALIAVVGLVCPLLRLVAQVVSLDPARMPAIGTVDERFQSHNIEVVGIIGG